MNSHYSHYNSMETLITFVRHGENVYAKPAQNWHPGANLTKNGKWQAEKAGNFLRPFKFDKVFSSDMNRTMQTANIIMSHFKDPKPSISFHRKLSEHDEILYEGPRKGSKYRSELSKAKSSVSYFQKILKDYPDKRILMVAHGNVIRACIGTALGFNIFKTPKLHLLHGSISGVIFKDGKVKDIYYVNSVSHYRKMKFIDKLTTVKFRA